MIACVVGGSNGIGASMVERLLEKNFSKVYVLDIEKPIINSDKIIFKKINLVNCNYNDCYFEDVDTLIITAGIGRLNFFEDFESAEIVSSFNINAISPIQIIRRYYDKISSFNDFYCAIITSIAGIVSSPLYALYSATKAAIFKFIEAVNAELEFKGCANRILNISPGKILGTKFHGDFTDLKSLKFLSDSILERMFSKENIFIPNIETYRDVINRYLKNPTVFAQESINYKLKGNNLQSAKKILVGYLSGTFDLFHIGHLNILKKAKEYCDYLIVGVHYDASHKNKDTFIPFEERMSIVGACRYVDQVVQSPSEDSEAWDIYRYDLLFVGSDYKGSERFAKYEKYLKNKAKIIYFDYTKTTSSTQLRETIEKSNLK